MLRFPTRHPREAVEKYPKLIRNAGRSADMEEWAQRGGRWFARSSVDRRTGVQRLRAGVGSRADAEGERAAA